MRVPSSPGSPSNRVGAIYDRLLQKKGGGQRQRANATVVMVPASINTLEQLHMLAEQSRGTVSIFSLEVLRAKRPMLLHETQRAQRPKVVFQSASRMRSACKRTVCPHAPRIIKKNIVRAAAILRLTRELWCRRRLVVFLSSLSNCTQGMIIT